MKNSNQESEVVKELINSLDCRVNHKHSQLGDWIDGEFIEIETV